MNAQLNLGLSALPATRRTDNAASHHAEERQNDDGWRNHDGKLVLLGFYAHPLATTKELAQLTGLDRHKVGKRAPDLLKCGYLERINGRDGWRWQLTSAGLAMVARINGHNNS